LQHESGHAVPRLDDALKRDVRSVLIGMTVPVSHPSPVTHDDHTGALG